MKTIPGPLQTILDSGQFYMADLYTLTLVGGTVLRYASGDADVTDGSGHVFSASGPAIDRSSISWKVGLEVDTLEMDVYPKTTDLIDSVPFVTACHQGALDGAEIELRRAFMSTYGAASPGTVILFPGRVGGLDIGGTKIAVTVNHFTELLNVKMPRNLYQPGCMYTLYDAGCGVNRATYTFNYTVGAGATVTTIPVPSTGKADHYFDQGVLVIGGARRSIKVWDLDTAVILPPLLSAPAQGTAVTMTAGCSKTMSDCASKFNNFTKYRGCPFIPQPEAGV
jgi:uncharacterized phage protein (TIGR02218 family)